MVVGANIEPGKFYDDFAVSRILGIRESVQKRARESNELKYTKKGPQILYRGQWLIDWLEPSEETTHS